MTKRLIRNATFNPMPELPEVETIRRDLAKKILAKRISRLKILDPKIKKAGSALPVDFLIGKKIKRIERIGKLLIFEIGDGKFLLLHLKMTGQLVYISSFAKRGLKGIGKRPLPNPPLLKGREIIAGGHENVKLKFQNAKIKNKYTRFIICFDDGSSLFFNDLRRFGYARIVGAEELEKIKSNFGIEPLAKNFTFENFKKSLADKKTAIKQALLNQKNIAGIGNIYADEILFAAKVNPKKPAAVLTKKELGNIFKASREIIEKAISCRGTTFSDYVDARGEKGNFSRFLKVYGRAGEKCRRCGQSIKKIKIAGRSAHFCPSCQKS